MLETRTRKKNQPLRRENKAEMKAAPGLDSHLLISVYPRSSAAASGSFRAASSCFPPAAWCCWIQAAGLTLNH